MTDRDGYMRQAIARWAHLPTDTEQQRESKKRKVMKTAEAIVREAELVSVKLPDLSTDQVRELWFEAVYDVCGDWVDCGGHIDPDDMLVMDEATAIRFEQLSTLARVELGQQRGEGTAGKLWRRRITRAIQSKKGE